MKNKMVQLTHPIIDIELVCSHFEESLEFYRDKLGFEVVIDIHIPEMTAVGAALAPCGFRSVRLKAGSTLIKLMEIDNPPPRRSHDFAAGVRWLTFVVEDIWQTKQELEAKGVEFITDIHVPADVRGVVCAPDPDGVLVEFVTL